MKRKLVVFTGAGISADSGIATFRDSDGLWENHSVTQVADYTTWKKNFEIVHRFYNERRAQLAQVEPNAAHRMVAQWQKDFDTLLITQNVDDLFERAGCTDVLHVHGKLTEMKCEACGSVWDIGYMTWTDTDRCVCGCRKGVKPNVVFFNEGAPLYKDMWTAFRYLTENDLLVVIGTSGQVIDIGSVAEDAPCPSILSNLATATTASMPMAPVVEDRQFHYVMHGRASDMATTLDAKVREILGCAEIAPNGPSA